MQALRTLDLSRRERRFMIEWVYISRVMRSLHLDGLAVVIDG